MSILWVVLISSLSAGKTIYVDDDGPADFNNIQAAIDDCNNGDVIIVAEGTYFENIHFMGKNITLTSKDLNNPDVVAATIIDGNDANSVVTFSGTEDSNCVLSGFTVTDGNAPAGGGIYGNGTLATIEYNVIKDNKSIEFYGGAGICDCDGLIRNNFINSNHAWGCCGGGRGGGLSECDGIIISNIVWDNHAYAGGGMYRCNGVIRNNLLVDNKGLYGGAFVLCNGTISNCSVVGNWCVYGALLHCNGTIKNCIIWQNGPETATQIKDCSTPTYSCIENWDGGGVGNISYAPCFANIGYWELQGTQWFWWDWIDNDGDYHLKSQAGRWDVNEGGWTKDDVTSPCIDAGDPKSPIGFEPFPNGGIINMGSFGGTREASKSYFGKPPCETIMAGDINGDCKVDFKDFAIMAFHWLEEH